MNAWIAASLTYLALAAVTFAPTLRALLSPVRQTELHAMGPAVVDSPPFSGRSKTMLGQHEQRIHGTLLFWKNQAAKYRSLHLYVLLWTIPSAIIIPILTQASDGSTAAKTLVTVVSGYTAILLAFHRAFRVEANF